MESVEPQKRTHSRLLVLFLVLSLFLHANIIALVILMGILAPPPPKPSSSEVTLNLIPLPNNPPQHLLATTPPDPNARDNPKAQIESDNNSQLATKRAIERSKNPMPDVDGRAPTQDLASSTFIPPKNQPVAPPAPDRQQSHPLTQKSSNNQPNPQQNPDTRTPLAQAPKPAPKPHTSPRVQPVVQQVDPNGLPVLPPIAGATLLPPEPQVQAVQGGAPPPSLEEQTGQMDGISAVSDHDAIDARKSDLGVYMAKVKRAIGSIWYPRVQNQMQLVSVGTVHIRVTIHSDGSVDVFPEDTEDESDRAVILRSLSMASIKEAGPFDPFPESMKKEYGDTYTDDFTFQVYGVN